MDWYPYEVELTLLRVLIPAELATSSSNYEPQKQLQGLTVDLSPNGTDGSWQRVGDGASAAPFATGWTEVNLEAAPLQRFVRVTLPASSGRCSLAEASFEGRMQPFDGLEQCDVTVSIKSSSGSAAATRADSYSFDADSTPAVVAVTPSYGSAAGGTTVVIEGSGLPTSVADAVVEVDGVACEVTSATAEALECITGERPGVPEARQFRVASRSQGDASVAGPGFVYKDLWSSRITWAGAAWTPASCCALQRKRMPWLVQVLVLA